MGPLSGVKIIELAGMGPGPFCGMVLADLGAEVIRVDRPVAVGRDAAWELRGRNKRSIALNLKSEQGLRALFGLIEQSDALIEGYRPGVAERLGIGPEPCLAANPKLVYGRATGWGQSGPMAMCAGHDINYIALSGALDMIGPAGGGPVPPLNLLGDYAGGAMFLAVGLLSAMNEAARTGKGQVVDAAMIDGVSTLLMVFYGFQASGELYAERGQNRLDGGAPWYDSYLTLDGKYMAVGAIEDRFYAEMLDGLGLSSGDIPDRSDRANWSALRVLFAQRFLLGTRDHWEQIFAGTDACVSPVLTLEEAKFSPHNVARGSVVTVGGIAQPCPAPRFSAHPNLHVTPPVLTGRDTCAILAELGWSKADIDTALSHGFAAQPKC